MIKKKISPFKKIIIFLTINISLMFIPFKSVLLDGGTTEYDAFLYKIINHDSRKLPGIPEVDEMIVVKHGKEIYIFPQNWIYNDWVKRNMVILVVDIMVFILFAVNVTKKKEKNFSN